MKKIILSTALALASITTMSAQDFFSTDTPEKLFTFGARIGLNTSNRTVNSSMVSIWNVNSWGTGFDAGAVADLNIRDFITIQPGFFYESRSGSYAYQSYAYNLSDADNYDVVKTQVGKGREYFFTIPVMGIVHFNVLEDLRWNVEFGPYFQIKLKSTFDGKFSYPQVAHDGDIYYSKDTKTTKCDVGLKMGTSLDICEHYYVGVHYLAGMLRAWNPAQLGGRNKAWLFTIGYNF